MEWQRIIGFYHVTKLGSFTKAAEATFRTQSAISQQIKNLEEELGCQLLERIGKKKVRLTSAGEKFFIFSESIRPYVVITFFRSMPYFFIRFQTVTRFIPRIRAAWD